MKESCTSALAIKGIHMEMADGWGIKEWDPCCVGERQIVHDLQISYTS